MDKMAGPPTLEVNQHSNHNKIELLNLNDDCLIGILDFFDAVSLYVLCFVNERIRRIIIDQVISRKLINFESFGNRFSTVALFEMFGPTMTRIKISDTYIQCTTPSLSKLEEFLLLLIRYGREGSLTEIDLAFDMPEMLNQRVIMDSVAYFRNVKTFSIRFAPRALKTTIADTFLSSFPFDNVRTLRLKSITSNGEWLRSDKIVGVEHLQICNAVINEEKFKYFLTKANRLKSFTFSEYNSNVDHYKLLRMVVQNVPNIEEIHDENPAYRLYNLPICNRSYLRDFNLQKLTIMSYHRSCDDLFEVVNGLAKRNTLKSLIIVFYEHKLGTRIVTGSPIVDTIWKQFTNLTTLGLMSLPKTAPKDFLKKICANLINVQEIMYTHANQRDIEVILRNATKLRSLDVNYYSLKSRFYLKLLNIKKRLMKKQNDNERYPLVLKIYPRAALECKVELQAQYEGNIIALSKTDLTDIIPFY